MASSGSSSSWEDMAKDTVKDLAPWRAGLDWWVILIEGIVVGLVGLLMLINPEGTHRDLGLVFTAALAVAGILQLWSLFRNRAPESVDSLVSGRASIAVFTGVVVLVLFFTVGLTWPGGLITVGLACLVYGLLGLVLIFRWKGARRQNAIIETVLFTLVGLLLLWAQIGGATAVATAVRIIAWLSLAAGAALIALAFYRRSKGEEYDAAVEKVSETVQAQRERFGKPADDAAEAAVKDAVEAAKEAAESSGE